MKYWNLLIKYKRLEYAYRKLYEKYQDLLIERI